jgi:vesicle-associated membrane protein 72
MPLVYALVARAADSAPLAQHAAVPGNFEPVALECLQRAQRGGEERFTVTADGYGFHFVVHSGFVYVVVADAATGQQLPFACAKRVQDAWTERFWEKGRTAAANGMDKSFG